MKTCSVFIFQLVYITFHLKLSVFAAYPPYEPLENIALDCGSFDFQTLSFDGRNWTSDGTFISQSNSTAASIVSSIDPGVPQVPYKTARLFFSEFTYNFNLTPGPKFLSLHFYPTSYPGFDASKAFLSVTEGNHTLLSNFSASLAANYKDVYAFSKEFIVHVKNHSLRLTFSPSSNASDAFAFVNGIEVVSMPRNLYVRGENVPLPFVGYLYNPIRLDNTYALETVYRINVGGEDISPKSDSGMFRTWKRDDQYIFGANFGHLASDYDLQVKYTPTVPAHTAPDLVYGTARFMGFDPRINLHFNLSWFFPVETGFLYLVRLHFCELDRSITKINQKVFSIYMNEETAQGQADVITWSGGQGVPVYKDYVVMIPVGKEGIQNLSLDLRPNTEPKPQYYDSFLNGIEVFKLNNYGGNLAGLNPPQMQNHEGSSVSSSTSSEKRLVRIIGAVMAFIIVCFLAFWIRLAKQTKKKTNKYVLIL
ncbi:hypothetical protein JCGZ_15754 [Jatropha curcas]|uniref:Malectin-like domain-containing protein n=1 Tax=Jatropha curcas TaxID=180498 RepID=A0A067KYW8_JATCU|nr:hypothetical protein JCGZ_15754 [Jatropha curcas]